MNSSSSSPSVFHLQLFRAFAALGLALVTLAAPQSSQAQADLAVQKIYGRWLKTPANYSLGNSSVYYSPQADVVACTESWIAVSAPAAAERGLAAEGAVQIFNAVTGAWVREILPPLPAVSSRYFGTACAISGNQLAVGMTDPLGPGVGAVYIYSLPSGALVKTLTPTAPQAGMYFGGAVAFSGDWLVVGSPRFAGNKGRVDRFNLKTGAIAYASPAGAGDLLGNSVAIDGRTLIVGAPGANGSRGGVYMYDVATLAPVRFIQPAATAANELFGMSVAMQQGRAVIGSPGWSAGRGRIFVEDLHGGDPELIFAASDSVAGTNLGCSLAVNRGLVLAAGGLRLAGSNGTAYVFDLNGTSTIEVRQLNVGEAGFCFGYTVGWAGSTAVVSSPFDNTQAVSAGALYLFRPVIGASPLSKIFAKGDFTPGVVDAAFNAVGDVFMNGSGEIAFTSTMSGAGSGGGKDIGLWDTYPSAVTAGTIMRLATKSRNLIGPVPSPSFGTFSNVMPNTQALALFRTTLAGTGVTSLNNQAIYKSDGSSAVQRILRTGDGPSATYAGGIPRSFTEVRTSRENSFTKVGVTFTLRTNVASTLADNDSGMVLFNASSVTPDTVVPREGTAAGATGKTHGQFVGRLAYYDVRSVYPTAITEVAAAFNQGLFRKDFGSPEFLVAQKGDSPAAPGGIPYSAFIGESVDDGERILYRATLGAPAVTANNEGLWQDHEGSKTLILRKGLDVGPTLPGLKIARFLGFRAAFSQSLILVQLAGPGVTAANDQALLLYQTVLPFNNQVLCLMREGEMAPGCQGASIGTISRIEVEPFYGEYLVLATLTGAPKGTELALFRGLSRRTTPSGDGEILRRPVLALRKGWQFSGQPSKIKSFSIPNTQTASGAGTVGMGRIIREGAGDNLLNSMVITVDFDNGVRQIMKGTL